MDSILQVIHRINDWLDMFLPVALTVGAFGLSGYYAIHLAGERGRRDGIGPGILFGGQAFVMFVVLLALLWGVFFGPPYVLYHNGWRWELLGIVWRWLLSAVLLLLLVRFLTRKYSGKRGLVTAWFHLLVVFIGWLLLRWVGVLLFSAPLLVIYYGYLAQAASVIVPTSDPEDRDQNRKRILLLLSYAWGAQASMYVVTDHSGRKVERRIRGPLAGPLAHMGIPGLLWTRSHQAAGITTGVAFCRVDGPGAVFLRRLERPFQVVDLRTQLRVSVLDVISREGIHYQAVLFMAFRLGDEKKSRQREQEINQRNKPRENEQELVLPYSKARVQAVLSRTGLKVQNGVSTTFYWDEWVVAQVEETARQVLAQHSINGFWGPEGDVTSALSRLSDEIKKRVEAELRAAGVHLLTARVVNFRFAEPKAEDPIARQQLETWQALWQRRYEETLAQAEAEATRMKQEAWAYAQSLLLTSIAEGFEKVRTLHPDLPPATIALLFLSAIQDYITRYQLGGESQTEELKTVVARWLQASGESFIPSRE